MAFQSFWKEGKSPKVVRVLKRRKRVAAENKEMQAARKRDRFCRFPLCGCYAFHLRTDVAHQQHRGAGGNPSGDRTKTEALMLVCSARHRENRMSLDKGTIRWRALDKKLGANGPVAWDVDVRAIDRGNYVGKPHWVEVAVEIQPQAHVAWTESQLAILTLLKNMEL